MAAQKKNGKRKAKDIVAQAMEMCGIECEETKKVCTHIQKYVCTDFIL